MNEEYEFEFIDTSYGGVEIKMNKLGKQGFRFATSFGRTIIMEREVINKPKYVPVEKAIGHTYDETKRPVNNSPIVHMVDMFQYEMLKAMFNRTGKTTCGKTIGELKGSEMYTGCVDDVTCPECKKILLAMVSPVQEALKKIMKPWSGVDKIIHMYADGESVACGKKYTDFNYRLHGWSKDVAEVNCPECREAIERKMKEDFENKYEKTHLRTVNDKTQCGMEIGYAIKTTINEGCVTCPNCIEIMKKRTTMDSHERI